MHLSREMGRFEVVDLLSRRGDRNRYPTEERMESSRHQFRLAELLLLAPLAILAFGVNSAVNHSFYPLEDWLVDIWYDSIVPTSVFASLNSWAKIALEVFAVRSTDMFAAIIVAILLRLFGRIAYVAGLLLLVTMPFSPQVGAIPAFYPEALKERSLELAFVFAAIAVYIRLGFRPTVVPSSRWCVLVLAVFSTVGVLGWTHFNPVASSSIVVSKDGG